MAIEQEGEHFSPTLQAVENWLSKVSDQDILDELERLEQEEIAAVSNTRKRSIRFDVDRPGGFAYSVKGRNTTLEIPFSAGQIKRAIADRDASSIRATIDNALVTHLKFIWDDETRVGQLRNAVSNGSLQVDEVRHPAPFLVSVGCPSPKNMETALNHELGITHILNYGLDKNHPLIAPYMTGNSKRDDSTLKGQLIILKAFTEGNNDTVDHLMAHFDHSRLDLIKPELAANTGQAKLVRQAIIRIADHFRRHDDLVRLTQLLNLLEEMGRPVLDEYEELYLIEHALRIVAGLPSTLVFNTLSGYRARSYSSSIWENNFRDRFSNFKLVFGWIFPLIDEVVTYSGEEIVREDLNLRPKLIMQESLVTELKQVKDLLHNLEHMTHFFKDGLKRADYVLKGVEQGITHLTDKPLPGSPQDRVMLYSV